MLFHRSLTRALLIAASLSLVSACASREHVRPIFPPSADLQVEAKPLLDPKALAKCHEAGGDPAECSDAALTDHDIAIEGWGGRGWDAVARLCRWAERNGAKGLDCPSPDVPPRPG